jgi:hypothetical protein
MKLTTKETKGSHTNSLILERKLAFANLVRAYLKFNVSEALNIVVEKDGNISINGNYYKFDVADYTGCTSNYIFYNPSSGRLLIQKDDVKKIYKLDVNLYDESVN